MVPGWFLLAVGRLWPSDDDYDDARQDKLGKSAQMLRERLDKKFSQVFSVMRILTSKS